MFLSILQKTAACGGVGANAAILMASMALVLLCTGTKSGIAETTDPAAAEESQVPWPPVVISPGSFGFNRMENSEGHISVEELTWLTQLQNRKNISSCHDRIPVTARPEKLPACSKPGYIFDPSSDRCGKPGTKAHCGENMVFDYFERCVGTCRCSESWERCWGRPSILAGDRCDQVATQGPCPVGQTIVAVGRFNVECTADACLNAVPKNAINFSKVVREWRDYQHISDDEKNEPFLFTHRHECYLTETEAFCEPGKVARFLSPYKTPFCVPRDHDECTYYSRGAGTSPIKSNCGPGLMEDPVRSLCVPSVTSDFE